MCKTNLERIKKIENYLLPETRQNYIQAQAGRNIEGCATYLSKIGELELELQERYAQHFRDCAMNGRIVQQVSKEDYADFVENRENRIWREGEEFQGVDD